MEQSVAELHHTLHLSGLSCADCAEKMVCRVRNLPGVQEAQLNFAACTLTVAHSAPLEPILHTISEAGYGIEVAGEAPKAESPTRHFFHTHHRLLTTALSGALLLAAWLLGQSLSPWGERGLYLVALLIGGFWTFRRGIASLKALSFDMNALMTIAVVGAVAIDQWPEAATVAFLYSVSNFLESYTLEKTRKSIRGLMELTPCEALVRRHGAETRLPVEQVRVGDIVLVQPGEKIAVDGIIVAGASAVNQAAITGEAAPLARGGGDPVYAGTLNGLGALEVCVTALAADTTLARIIHLVEEAEGQRAPAQNFVDRFARYYTPAVLFGAALLAILPTLLFAQPWEPWFYRALLLVVVACPCALVISTPVAIVAALGNAARHGILIKGGAYLEQAGRLTAIAFDKTGTLTRGRPEVTAVLPLTEIRPESLLALAAAVEARTPHPLADAILREAHRLSVDVPAVVDAETLPGLGARAMVDGVLTYIGTPRLFAGLGADTREAEARMVEWEQRGATAMLVGTADVVLGIITAVDQPRAESRNIVQALRRAGIRHVVMLTGDNAETARAIAGEIGVDDVRANLLPEDKVAAMHALLAQHGAAAMVGDGINDAPALATATVGIAMGAAGTDTALETADIALMADDLSRVPYLMRLSRKTLAIIRQNIALAIIIKALVLVLIFPGWLTLWLAVLADMGASILVTLNGLRLVSGVRER